MRQLKNYINKMKKVLFSAIALALLATSSCKKDDDNNGPSNGWVLNNTTYNTLATSGNGGVILASSNSPLGFLSVTFASKPTANGTYRVISDNGTVGPNQVSFSVSSTATFTDTYESTGNGTVDATVTVNGGKVTINCPDVWVKKDGTTDSLKLSTNLTEL